MLMQALLRQPDVVRIETDEKTAVAKEVAGAYCLEDVTVTCRETDETLCIILQATVERPRFVLLRWRMKLPVDCRILGDALERGYGDLEWRGMVPERALPWYFLVNSNGVTAGCGVRTNPAALCWWQVDGQGVSLCMDVRCGQRGVALAGRCLEVAQVVCLEGTEMTPFAAAGELCRRMSRGAVLPRRPVYGSNNWYYAYGQSSHEEILADTRLLASLTAGLDNRPYMVIDDGWEKTYASGEDRNGGPWSEGNRRFPDRAQLAADLREQGAIPGIWFRPLLHRGDDLPESWRLPHRPICLDPSRPEVLEWIAEDVGRMNAWGYRLLKHDFTTYDVLGHWGFQWHPRYSGGDWCFGDESRTTAEILRRLYETIFGACHEDTVVLGCNCIGHLGVGAMHLNRIGDDISGFRWERTRRMGVNSLAFRLAQHKHFFDVDADCIGILGEIDWEKNRQWLHLLQNSGTPLFVSAKPSVLTEKQKTELAEAFRRAAVQTDVAEPLDWLYTTCPQEWRINGERVTYQWMEEENSALSTGVL